MNELEHLADTIRRSHHGPAWHGPSLSEVLEGVTAEQAFQRFGDIHSIWELTEHAIAWQDIVRRRMEGERLDSDKLSWEENWPPVLAATEENWQKTLKRAAEANQQLCQRVLKFDDEKPKSPATGDDYGKSKLDSTVPGKDYTFAVMLHGAAQHVIYHAGQIAILKKVLPK